MWPTVRLGLVAEITALANEMARVEWMSPVEIEERQLRQFRNLLRFVKEHSPFYAQRFTASGASLADFQSIESLRALPLLSRRELQAAGEDFFCTDVPEDQGKIGTTATSGSTGEPVRIRRTAIAQLFLYASVVRSHEWHQTSFKSRYSGIRANAFKYLELETSGAPFENMFETGLGQIIPITMPLDEQIEVLQRFQPETLSVYPTNLRGLVEKWRREGFGLNALTHIKTIGETLPDDLRQKVAELNPNIVIIDGYSSQECGAIAQQCPHGSGFHVMAESLIVEVLNEQNLPCDPGEIGRIVITDIQNLASPIIRYDIGDYAEVGSPCECGRGLMKLDRILGRQRNLVVKPNGDRHWPLVGFHDFDSIAPIRRYQMVQESLQQITVRFVTDEPLSQDQKSAFVALIQKALGYEFDLEILDQRDDLPSQPNGKFEEFISKVA